MRSAARSAGIRLAVVLVVIYTPFFVFLLLQQQKANYLRDFNPTIWKGVPSSVSTHGHLISSSVEEEPSSINSTMAAGPPTAATNIKSKAETSLNKSTIAACILVMDDSIRLLEWLAYHYTVLPLSHLLVVMDPSSKRVSTMVEVLDSWRSRINITVHVNDAEWMTLNETEGFMKPIYQKDDPTQFENWFLDKKSRQFQINNHDRRQTHMITHCGNLMRENNMTWTLLTDTDEFLLFNYIHATQENASLYTYTVKRPEHRTSVDIERARQRPYREALPPFSSRITIADYLEQNSISNRTACLLIPGILVSSCESKLPSNHNLTKSSSSPGKDSGSRHLTTLRNTWTEVRHGDFTKGLLDVSQLRRRTSKEQFEPDMVYSIHWPNKQLCKGIQRRQVLRRGNDYMASLLRIHHYASGTWEAFIERAGQDRRQVGNRRNVSAVDRFLSRSTAPKLKDVDLTPWVDWFVEKVGSEQAEALLFAPLAQRYDQFREVDPSILKKLEQLSM